MIRKASRSRAARCRSVFNYTPFDEECIASACVPRPKRRRAAQVPTKTGMLIVSEVQRGAG